MRQTVSRSISETRIARTIPLETLRPALPENYSDLSTPERQAAVDRAKNLLQVRRNLIELEAARRRADGEIMQYEADADAIQERLRNERDELSEHRQKHLYGRLMVCRSKIERLQELKVQYKLEIDLYLDLLNRG